MQNANGEGKQAWTAWLEAMSHPVELLAALPFSANMLRP